MNNNYYSYYCTTIKDMMKLAKAENKSQLLTSNDETLYVKYCDSTDDYTIQCYWRLSNVSNVINQEVMDVLGKYDPLMGYEEMVTRKLDIIQIAMVTVMCKNQEDAASVIDHFKKHRRNEVKDTSYIFCGKKLLRVIQYYGCVRNPLESLDSICKWNDTGAQCLIRDEEMKQVTRDINYRYSKEAREILFSLGFNNGKTNFVLGINETIPQFIFIDTFLGIFVNRLITF